MNPDPPEGPSARPPPGAAPPDDACTGLPGLRTWPQVYGVVVGAFVVWVALLALFSRVFG